MGCKCLLQIIILNHITVWYIHPDQLKGERAEVFYQLLYKICFSIAFFNAKLPVLFQNSRSVLFPL